MMQTFVQNHDTQECQSLEAPVEPWFVPLAYAFILLYANRGYPCVFYGDLYGIRGPRPRPPACDGKLSKLVLARKLYAYGPQINYFDCADCGGWTRIGHEPHSGGAGLAVVMNAGCKISHKRMSVGSQHAGERWTDILGRIERAVLIDRKGWGVFPVRPRSVGVWVSGTAEGRAQTDDLEL
jgi:alpha-amylase